MKKIIYLIIGIFLCLTIVSALDVNISSGLKTNLEMNNLLLPMSVQELQTYDIKGNPVMWENPETGELEPITDVCAYEERLVCVGLKKPICRTQDVQMFCMRGKGYFENRAAAVIKISLQNKWRVYQQQTLTKQAMQPKTNIALKVA